MVSPTGRLDAATAPALDQLLAAQISEGATRIVIDLADTEYVSSAGLRSVLLCARSLGARGGKVGICGAGGLVAEVLSISGFTDLMPVRDTLAETLAAM